MGSFILGGLVKWLLPSVGTAISGYVIALLRKQLQRAGLELTAQQEAQLRAIVQAAIRRVEEEARTDSTVPTSTQKLDHAVADVVHATGLDQATATKLVHEELPIVRAQLTPRFINPGLPGGGRR